jgi:diphosphomevalonate decarboxylase
MSNLTATAIANSNIALIKYWGNQDDNLRLPANGSISMNLDGLTAHTWVTYAPGMDHDSLILNSSPVSGEPLNRVTHFLDLVRAMAGVNLFAEVVSENNFPTGAGIASSAAAFAALSLAATSAIGLELSEMELSLLARRGSGSACRSVPGGFVEWIACQDECLSYAYSFAPPDYWDLVDCIAVVEANPKLIGSTDGHRLAGTSPLQAARVQEAPRRLDLCRQAILARDFEALAAVIELDSNLMHAVMMTSTPPLFYWTSASLDIMKSIPQLRKEGLPVCYTVDAGPNVHVLCTLNAKDRVITILQNFPRVKHVFSAKPGDPARLV